MPTTTLYKQKGIWHQQTCKDYSAFNKLEDSRKLGIGDDEEFPIEELCPICMGCVIEQMARAAEKAD